MNNAQTPAQAAPQTFQALFCEAYRCRPEDARRRMFWLSLHRRAWPLAIQRTAQVFAICADKYLMRAYASIKAHLVCGGIALLIYDVFFLGQVLLLASLIILWSIGSLMSIPTATRSQRLPAMAPPHGEGMAAHTPA
jgi:hypothetical protein